MKKLLALILILSFSISSYAETPPNWAMPLALTTKNTKVKFEVDTTWHMVYGTVNSLKGNITLQDPTNPFSIASEIIIPVKDISTGWGMRDSSFQDSMGTEKFPEIVFKSNEFKPTDNCSMESLKNNVCKGILEGTLKIRDVERAISLGVTISHKENNFIVEGQITFPWAKFNVDDPSIIMAKVKPDVTVFYKVILSEVK